MIPEPTGGFPRVTSIEGEDEVKPSNGGLGFTDAVAHERMMVIPTFVKGIPVDALVDCGATHNVMSDKLADKTHVDITEDNPPRTVTIADGSKVVIRGTARQVPMRIGNTTQLVDFMVLKVERDLILGMEWLNKLNPHIDWKRRTISWVPRPPTWEEDSTQPTIPTTTTQPVQCDTNPMTNPPKAEEKPTKPKVKTRDDQPTVMVVSAHRMRKLMATAGVQLFCLTPTNPEHQVPSSELATIQVHTDHVVADPRMEAMLREYSDVFPDELPLEPTRRDIEHKIRTIDGAPPYYEKFRRLEVHLYEEMQKQLATLLKQGRIRPSASPWGAPMVFAKKPDGT